MDPIFKITGQYTRTQGERRTYSYTIQGDSVAWEGLIRHNGAVKGMVGGRVEPGKTQANAKSNPEHVRKLVEHAIENLIYMRE